MSAATDSRNASGLGAGLTYAELALSYTGPIAANINLPSGTVAAKLAASTATSPVVYPFTTGASKIALGFVRVGFDNTGGVQGARPISVVSEVGKLVDANSGGGSAITGADAFKVAYLVDNQTCSKLAADGEAGGMILGVDADGAPMVGVGPLFLALARGFALAQQSTTGTTTGFTAGSGSTAKSDSTFTGNTGSSAYTVGDIVKALKTVGILAA